MKKGVFVISAALSLLIIAYQSTGEMKITPDSSLTLEKLLLRHSKQLVGRRILLALPSCFSGMGSTSRIVGGMATPTAWKILPQTPLLWLLMASRLPFSSTVTVCNAFKSCLISAHSKRWPALTSLRSSSFRSTSAKKLQNTWPRIV